MRESETERCLQFLVKNYLDRITPDERVDFLSNLVWAYCHRCGYQKPQHGNCQCWNDE